MRGHWARDEDRAHQTAAHLAEYSPSQELGGVYATSSLDSFTTQNRGAYRLWTNATSQRKAQSIGLCAPDRVTAHPHAALTAQ
jgi:hypothetical protein